MESTGNACAKIILLGEHAVVYGFSGICVPIKELNTIVTSDKCDNVGFAVDKILTDNEMDKFSAFVQFVIKKFNVENTRLNFSTEIPFSSGFGSSASVSVAAIRCVSDIELSKQNEIAYACEKFFHGNPSGIDNTTIVYETPIFFRQGNKTDFIKIKNKLHLIIVMVSKKSETMKAVSHVMNLYKKNRNEVLRIFKEMEKLVIEGKKCMEKGDLNKFGLLMNKNHVLLTELGLSTPEIELIREVALDNKVLGAKISGAGMGGNLVLLVEKDNRDKIHSAISRLSKKIFLSDIY